MIFSMFKCRRSVAISVVFMIAVGAAFGMEKPRLAVDLHELPRQAATPNAENPQSEASQTEVSSILSAIERIEAAIRSLKPEVDKKESDQKEQREKADLTAQQEMSRWSYWVMIPTWITAFLSAVALFAILRTLHHTRRAADYAQQMVGEAQKTTNAAIQTIKSDRAWVTFMKCDTNYLTNSTIFGVFSKNTVGFSIDWINAGKTPAISVDLYWEIQTIHIDADLYVFRRPESTGNEKRTTSIGPSIVCKCDIMPLTEGQTQLLMKRSIRVLLYNHIIYKDIFDATEFRHAEVCFEVLFVGLNPNNQQPQFTFKPTGDQNSIG